MNWLEITINTNTDKIDDLCEMLENLSVEGVVIDDEAVFADFLENDQKYWDYIDDELVTSMQGVCRIKFYLEDSPGGERRLKEIRHALPEETLTVNHVRDEDWENNWRAYYKPIEIGDRLLVVPEWETIPDNTDRVVLRLDPGLIFGTGTHATTRMCLKSLETCTGKSVLDIGCGSGILMIAALLLGAARAVGCDIDEKAPKVAMENSSLNCIPSERLTIYAGDILSDTKLKEQICKDRYDIVLANIVADVIMMLGSQVTEYLKPDGIFICSGIIEGRQEEIKESLINNGLRILSERFEDGWYCYLSEQSNS